MRKSFILRSDFKLMELQNFPSYNRRLLVYFGPNFFLQLVWGGFGVRVLGVIVQSPKDRFFFESRMALLIGDSGSLRQYVLGEDVSTALMSLSHKVTASFSSSSCLVMSVSILSILKYHAVRFLNRFLIYEIVIVKDKFTFLSKHVKF